MLPLKGACTKRAAGQTVSGRRKLKVCATDSNGVLRRCQSPGERSRNPIVVRTVPVRDLAENLRDDDGVPIKRAPRTLGFAVWSENVDLVRELLVAGAPVDDYGSKTPGVTPLMESVDEPEAFYDDSRSAITHLLLSAGADPNRRDHAARGALHYAAGAGARAVDLLLAAGAEPNAVDDRGRTALHEAIDRGSVTAALVLCRSVTNIAVRDQDGNTAADLFRADQNGFTPKECAHLKDALQIA